MVHWRFQPTRAFVDGGPGFRHGTDSTDVVVKYCTAKQYNLNVQSWKLTLRHSYAADNPIHTKFGLPVENDMPMTTSRSNSKPEVEFQNGGRSFSKPEVIWTQSWIEISLWNLVYLEILIFWGHAHCQTGTGSWFAPSMVATLKLFITS